MELSDLGSTTFSFCCVKESHSSPLSQLHHHDTPQCFRGNNREDNTRPESYTCNYDTDMMIVVIIIKEVMASKILPKPLIYHI